MQQLNEILWYLTEALNLKTSLPIQDELKSVLEVTERLTLLDPDSIVELDVPAHRDVVNDLFLRTSELVRTEFNSKQKSSKIYKKTHGRGADYMGAKLRGAYFIAADLREADLRYLDLIGADFRDADIRGSDQSGRGTGPTKPGNH